MTIPTAVATVMAIVQFAKKLFPKIVQGPVAIVLVILSSIGVTLYKYVTEGLPITFDAFVFCVEVIIASLSAYSLIKVAGGTVTT